MADNDRSILNLRYNQITQNLEGFGGGSPQWTELTLHNVDPTQVPVTRLINTTAPLTGGGNLSADRTLSMPAATGSTNGYLTSSDWTTFTSKQPAGSYLTAGTGVTDVHSDANPALHGSVQLVSGTNVTLSQVGQAITVTATGGVPFTDVTAFAPTITGLGATSSEEFYWRKINDVVDIWGTVKAGIPTADQITLTLPVNIGMGLLPGTFDYLGDFRVYSSTSFSGDITYISPDTTVVYVTLPTVSSAGSFPDPQLGSAIVDPSAYVSVRFSYPV